MGAPFHNRITIDAGKRGGKPCIRGLRITVYDVLGWLASGMDTQEIIDDFPESDLALLCPWQQHSGTLAQCSV